MFGTFYMPKNEMPEAYGIDDQRFPGSFGNANALSVQAVRPNKDENGDHGRRSLVVFFFFAIHSFIWSQIAGGVAVAREGLC